VKNEDADFSNSLYFVVLLVFLAQDLSPSMLWWLGAFVYYWAPVFRWEAWSWSPGKAHRSILKDLGEVAFSSFVWSHKLKMSKQLTRKFKDWFKRNYFSTQFWKL